MKKTILAVLVFPCLALSAPTVPHPKAVKLATDIAVAKKSPGHNTVRNMSHHNKLDTAAKP